MSCPVSCVVCGEWTVGVGVRCGVRGVRSGVSCTCYVCGLQDAEWDVRRTLRGAWGSGLRLMGCAGWWVVSVVGRAAWGLCCVMRGVCCVVQGFWCVVSGDLDLVCVWRF